MREQPFMKALMIALGNRKDMRIHRQNTGGVDVYKHGQCVGHFEAGPPPGAADISGIVAPQGWRIEIETKAEDTETRPSQDSWRDMIRRMGGIYVRVRYNEGLTMKENIADATRTIETAIVVRRTPVQ